VRSRTFPRRHATRELPRSSTPDTALRFRVRRDVLLLKGCGQLVYRLPYAVDARFDLIDALFDVIQCCELPETLRGQIHGSRECRNQRSVASVPVDGVECGVRLPSALAKITGSGGRAIWPYRLRNRWRLYDRIPQASHDEPSD